ncbi:MAG TPA: ATP-binding protein [Candidatus Polarisedimenticolaceae bacterium]|nr:ATP-binding protein [Candidatus Polarisedimenticolaceae bacterium]
MRDTALLGGSGAVLATIVLLWTADLAPRTRWTVVLAAVVPWLVAAWTVEDRAARPLRALANLLEALRAGDTSFRLRSERPGDALDEVVREANALRDMLRGERLATREATALLRAVTEEIDVALFVLDAERRVRFANRRGARLLGKSPEALAGMGAAEAGLRAAVTAGGAAVRPIDFPGDSGRWQVRRVPLREGGLPRELVTLSDVGPTLREEERQAWQRLMRVLGHEVRNSLAPIRSIAEGLRGRLARREDAAETRRDLLDGLAIITDRSASLGRFLEGYARLARLPRPVLAPVEVGLFVRDAARLETRIPVQVDEGAPVTVRADRAQLEQVLINLLRNAADASIETGGGVRLGWATVRGALEIHVEDDGPGLGAAENLFVPFYTTKPDGTGIGLVLSRQIVEAHGGTLTLENRRAVAGCLATLRLPL